MSKHKIEGDGQVLLGHINIGGVMQMEMQNLSIREAALDDSNAIAALMTQLGYQTGEETMARRLHVILQARDYQTYVAIHKGQVVGLVGTRTGYLYEDDGVYGQIMVLVVDETLRRKGIGEALMQQAESVLREASAATIVITTGNHRSGAHALYEELGYEPTGRRYKKSLRL